MTTTRKITFHGGPADGHELEIPVIGLQDTLHVKALTGGVILYLEQREGTTLYRRRLSDDVDAEYEAVSGQQHRDTETP